MDPLDEGWQRLIAEAKQAAGRAYCRYSRFPVGGAVLTGAGAIYAGCNVENASFGLTVCAERNAVFQAVARGDRAIRRVVVYTPTATPTAPCGPCRQVINEFNPDAEILCVCDGTDRIRRRLSELLPDAFGPANVQPGTG